MPTKAPLPAFPTAACGNKPRVLRRKQSGRWPADAGLVLTVQAELHVTGDASPSTNLIGYQGTALELPSGPFGQGAGCEEGGTRGGKGQEIQASFQEFPARGSWRNAMPSAPSQRSDPGLDKRAGPSCGLSCFGQPRFYEKTMEGQLAESLSSPAPHTGTAFLRRTPQQHPAGGPAVYRGPWSGGGGLGKIKQTTKASRVGGSPLLNS